MPSSPAPAASGHPPTRVSTPPRPPTPPTPPLRQVLLDFASLDKRRAALCTLWRLLRHTAQPRKGHPDHAASEALKRRILLTLLTELLHPTMTDSRGARLELLRALGVVGATDPAVLQAKPEGGAPAGGGASSV
eukprot:scaffold22696_cov63-Isochrysis_galbana.AAC.2